MKASDLIQILMRDDNIDKDIVIVNTKNGDTFDIEGYDDVSHEIKIQIHSEDLTECEREHAEDGECLCDCDLCRHCLEQ